MKSRFVLLGGLLNATTLMTGLLLGFFLGTSYSGHTNAQVVQQQVQDYSPGATVGSFGAGLILAHEIQSDKLVVNGYDVLKLQQNTLNYMGSHLIGTDTAALQSIVNQSRADTLYRVKPPTAQVPPPPEKKP